MEKKPIQIKDLPIGDRPREKLVQRGKDSLTDSELLALLIGNGTRGHSALDIARDILKAYNNSWHDFSKVSFKELQKAKGIGKAKAITILAALEIANRRTESPINVKTVIKSSADVYNLFSSKISYLDHEEVWIALLDNKNTVLHTAKISQGGTTAAIVDSKIVFGIALEYKAKNIIMAHNHPSNSLKPSMQDDKITQKIDQASKLFDITLLDHIIITNTDYFSYKDSGKL